MQTVHDISVYTNWNYDSIYQGFAEKNKIFYILTNSRAFTEEQTIKVHQEIARNIIKVAKEQQKSYIIVNRSDSTLRGHYPLETKVLKMLSNLKMILVLMEKSYVLILRKVEDLRLIIFTMLSMMVN